MEQKIYQRVVCIDGLAGRIVQSLPAGIGRPERVLIQFDDGRQAVVARDALIAQDDGSFGLAVHSANLALVQKPATSEADESIVVLPVIQEELQVGRRRLTTGVVQVTKHVHEHEELIEEPLLRETVDVERVAINQMIADGDEQSQARYQGETLIIPVLEEVVVVEKRLLLKEELHITRRRTEERQQQRVTVRSEEVVVNRADPEEIREVGDSDSA